MRMYKVLTYAATFMMVLVPFVEIFSTTSAAMGSFSAGITLLVAAGAAYTS